ncbi:histidine kinase dimerization/phospho-acceptor domain-containing protein [Haloglomus litoreum]|uniref:sensor histidine kinase n=1 Tax=Haloglomus litoreum TaxID=3034026 RepID=UPI0023E79BAB|nr:histidine kinase dimerization/phospho-acceptor domain-containing protein [Haloglomus sp. DT116]
MERRERAFRELATLVRDRERPFVDRVREGLELGCVALGVEYGALARADGGEHTVLAVATRGDAPGAPGDSRPLGETFCELPVTDRETVGFGHPDDGPPGVGDRAAHTTDGFSCYVGAPVTVDERVYGTCCFADREPREAFADWERELVGSLAAWMSDGLTARARKLALASESDRLDGFTAMIDHDIREPLSTARGHAQLAHEAATEADAAEVTPHTEATVTALSRTERLVADLLRLGSDSERAGGAGPVDVRAVAEHAWAEVTTDDTMARLTTEPGVRVPADESLLKRLLAETFRFCLETGDDALEVTVGSLGDRPGFYVADDGTGFPGESGDRPAGDSVGLDSIERIAAAHDWTVTAGLSADGGLRVEVETDEGIWPASEMTGHAEEGTAPVATLVEEWSDDGSESGSDAGPDSATDSGLESGG